MLGWFYSFCPKAINPLNLVTERLDRKILEKYKAKRANHHIYRAAARLWASAGVPWEKALGIVTDAFHAAIQ